MIQSMIVTKIMTPPNNMIPDNTASTTTAMAIFVTQLILDPLPKL